MMPLASFSASRFFFTSIFSVSWYVPSFVPLTMRSTKRPSWGAAANPKVLPRAKAVLLRSIDGSAALARRTHAFACAIPSTDVDEESLIW